MIRILKIVTLSWLSVSVMGCVASPTPRTAIRVARKLTAPAILELVFRDDIVEAIGDTVTIRTNDEGRTDTASVILAERIGIGGVTRYIAITERRYGECHACKAIIGGISLAKMQGGWEVEAANPALIFRGTFGHVHSAVLTQIGPNKYGVVIESGASYHGYYAITTDVVAVVGSAWTLIYNGIATRGADRYYTNMECADLRQGCKWEYTTEMNFMVGTGDEYYDLQIIQSGTNAGGYTFKTREVFSMESGQYTYQSNR